MSITPNRHTLHIHNTPHIHQSPHSHMFTHLLITIQQSYFRILKSTDFTLLAQICIKFNGALSYFICSIFVLRRKLDCFLMTSRNILIYIFSYYTMSFVLEMIFNILFGVSLEYPSFLRFCKERIFLFRNSFYFSKISILTLLKMLK